MTEPVPENATELVLFQRTLVVDSKFSGRMSAATIRYLLLTPGRIVRIVLPSLIVAVVVSSNVNSSGIATVGVFILALLALPGLFVLVLLIAYIPARRQISERLPVGSEYSLVMTDDSMRLKDPMVATDISYQLYKSLRVSKGVVALMPRRGRRPTIVPRELFTTESLHWLASRLTGAQ